VNIERIQRLHDHCASLPTWNEVREDADAPFPYRGPVFDLGTWSEKGPHPECGVQGCLAGWTIELFGTNEDLAHAITGDHWIEVASRLLDITPEQGEDVFMYNGSEAGALQNLRLFMGRPLQ